METKTIAGHRVNIHRYNSVIIGAGAAGMNCAVHLCEFMSQKGIENPHSRIAVVTRGVALGASRMSGSDKQTYYKMGTSPQTADSAEEFAKSLTAAGCCHEDLAIIEGITSLREFYHLARSGVPFPRDPMGSYIGYKTDHDPYERATSAGPKTSRFMSECLQIEVERCGIEIFDHQEIASLLRVGGKVVGVVCLDTARRDGDEIAMDIFLCENLILAAGGPGELYETTVYPRGQVGIHGLAFAAGLTAENLTESQFGLASMKFRWNVSGTYMQVIPRIFSTDAEGNDDREFLADFFPTMGKMATDIFLKGYQWPFDPQRIENHQSSLIDVLVFNEISRGRRVFMDFLSNPAGSASMKEFAFDDLDAEALTYLENADALQDRPIDRLAHMNQPAIDIYTENGIDLWSEPLEIAVCAQHNNGGFAVNKWWESNVPHVFVIGEMAGTHGVKRPGGSALNAGQVGGLRAAEYIANAYGWDMPEISASDKTMQVQLTELFAKLEGFTKLCGGLAPADVIKQVRRTMTLAGGHIREISTASQALKKTLELYGKIQDSGMSAEGDGGLAAAIQAEHLTLTAVAYLKAVVELLGAGGGSRGSHIVLSDDGIEIHPDVINPADGKPLKFKPENEELRKSIIQIQYDPNEPDLFRSKTVPVRKAPTHRKAFEPAWADFREGKIFE